VLLLHHRLASHTRARSLATEDHLFERFEEEDGDEVGAASTFAATSSVPCSMCNVAPCKRHHSIARIT
jgi:hypothetical protein